MSADLLKIVSKRAMLNEKSDTITLDLDIGPDIPTLMAESMSEINPYIPSWMELPYLQSILSETMTTEEV
jgi:myosin-5